MKRKGKVTGIELIMAATELARTAGKFFAATYTYEGELGQGNYVINARVNDGVNYIGLYAPDGTVYRIDVNLEKMKVIESTVATKANEESEKVDLINGTFEENRFPEEWQPALDAFCEKQLGKAVEAIWDDQVVDIIKCININYGVMFIIPNHACTADQFCISTDEKAEQAKIIAELNDADYDRATTKLVEVWMSCPRGSWYIDNLQCHDPSVKDKDGNRYWLRFPHFIPETVLSKFQEGALELLKFPVEVEKYVSDDAGGDYDETYNKHHLSTIVNFQVIPAQTITRYSFCGPFEDALKKVTA